MAEKFVYTPTRFMLPDSRYDKKRADHAVAFIEQLKHVKTDWAGKPFLLLPWQETIVRDLFGVIKPSGARQFTHCFVEVPKKSGKSELAAAIALYLLCADGENGAEIYSVANDREQAAIVFELAMKMVQSNGALSKYCKIIESRKRIVFLPTSSYYVALSSEVKNKYGLNVHGCIFDELLGQTSRKLYDTMTLGANAARRQPLNFVITTAGTNKESICYNEHCYSLDLLAGRKEDPSYYPVVFAARDDDDWTDPEVWKRVNPSFGITVSEEYYQSYLLKAKYDVEKEFEFRQFYLNQWMNSKKAWLPMDKYDACAEQFDPVILEGRECYGGLDLASSDDIAAFVLVFPPENDEEFYYILPRFWIPRENMERRVRKDKVPYLKWVNQGFLLTTEGNIIHYDFIEEEIKKLSKTYNIQQISYDRWGAAQLTAHLRDAGFKMVDFGQGFKSFAQPCRELLRLVLDEKLRHNGQPVLRWMFENVVVETDAAANLKPTKQRSGEKIDGAVATIMALSLAVFQERKPEPGILLYDSITDTFTRNGVVLDVPKRKPEDQLKKYYW